jgi:hypothetical protein
MVSDPSKKIQEKPPKMITMPNFKIPAYRQAGKFQMNIKACNSRL